jgi:hypothetical protein
MTPLLRRTAMSDRLLVHIITLNMNNPKYVLQKMSYRFTRGYQLPAGSSACGWFLSLDLQRSRP